MGGKEEGVRKKKKNSGNKVGERQREGGVYKPAREGTLNGDGVPEQVPQSSYKSKKGIKKKR